MLEYLNVSCSFCAVRLVVVASLSPWVRRCHMDTAYENIFLFPKVVKSDFNNSSKWHFAFYQNVYFIIERGILSVPWHMSISSGVASMSCSTLPGTHRWLRSCCVWFEGIAPGAGSVPSNPVRLIFISWVLCVVSDAQRHHTSVGLKTPARHVDTNTLKPLNSNHQSLSQYGRGIF